ncbi:unnamed protein product [Phyllotreta striolata]|uniref:Uncharacterized protein n=1 Tax=Phyllotreta striolata TaxID=444603 RepID=A0A9N9XJD5_PHYSR|nr:unnamed protein product [Phyllotreta striolata]
MQNSADNGQVREHRRQVPENGAEVSNPAFRKFNYTLLQPAFGEHISVPLVKSIMQNILRKANSRRNNSSGSLAYVNNLRNQILYVHKLNMKAFELSSCYPYSDFSQLLCKYVLVECEILNKNPHFPAKRKLQIQHRILRLLRFIHNEYFECIITPKGKDIAKISAKPIFDIFVELKCNPLANFELLESMTILLLKAIGLYEKVKTSMNQQRSTEDGPDPNLAIFATNVIAKYSRSEQPSASWVTPADDTNDQHAVPSVDLQQATNSSGTNQLGPRNFKCENQTNNKKSGDKNETSQTSRVEVGDNSIINLSKCNRLAKIDALIDSAKKKNVEDHQVPSSSKRIVEGFTQKKGVVKLFTSPQVIDEIDLTDDEKKNENQTTNSACLPTSTTTNTTNRLFSKINCLDEIDALIDSRKPSITDDSQNVKKKEDVCVEIDLTNDTEKKKCLTRNSLDAIDALIDSRKQRVKDSSQRKKKRKDLALKKVTAPSTSNIVPESRSSDNNESVPTLLDNPPNITEQSCSPVRGNISSEVTPNDDETSSPTCKNNTNESIFVDKADEIVKSGVKSTFQSSNEKFCAVIKKSEIEVNHLTDNSKINNNEPQKLGIECNIEQPSNVPSAPIKDYQMFNPSRNYKKTYIQNYFLEQNNKKKTEDLLLQQKVQLEALENVNLPTKVQVEALENANLPTKVQVNISAEEKLNSPHALSEQSKLDSILEEDKNSSVILGVEENHDQVNQENKTTQEEDNRESSEKKLNNTLEVKVDTLQCMPESSPKSLDSETIENLPSNQIGEEKTERLSTNLQDLKDTVEQFVNEERKHSDNTYQTNETEIKGAQDEPTNEEITFNDEPTNGETMDNCETTYDKSINGETVCNGPSKEDTNCNEANGEVFHNECTTNKETLYNEQINGNTIYQPITRQTHYIEPTNGETAYKLAQVDIENHQQNINNVRNGLFVLADAAEFKRHTDEIYPRRKRNNRRQMGDRRVTRSSSKSEDSDTISNLFNFTPARGNRKKNSLKFAKCIIEATSDEMTNSTRKNLVIKNTRGRKPKVTLNNDDFTSLPVVTNIFETQKPSKISVTLKTTPWNVKKTKNKTDQKVDKNNTNTSNGNLLNCLSLKKNKGSPHQNQIERLSKILKNDTPVAKTRSSSKKLQLPAEEISFDNFIKKQKKSKYKVDSMTRNLLTEDSLVISPVHNAEQKTKNKPKENLKKFLPTDHIEIEPKTPSKSSPNKNHKGLPHIDEDVRNKVVKNRHGTRSKNSPTKINKENRNNKRNVQDISPNAVTQKPVQDLHENLLDNKSTSPDSQQFSLKQPKINAELENDRNIVKILPLEISPDYEITPEKTRKIYYFDRSESDSREEQTEPSTENKLTCLANEIGAEIECVSSKIEETPLNHQKGDGECPPNENVINECSINSTVTEEETRYKLLPTEIPQVAIFNQLPMQTDHNNKHLKNDEIVNLPAETSPVFPNTDEDSRIDQRDISSTNQIEVESNENLQMNNESLPNYPINKQEIQYDRVEEPLTETDNTQRNVNLPETEPNCSEVDVETIEYEPGATRQVASLSEREVQIDGNMKQQSPANNPITDEEMEDECTPSNKLDTQIDDNAEDEDLIDATEVNSQCSLIPEELEDNENINKTLPTEMTPLTSEELVSAEDKIKYSSIENTTNAVCDAEAISSLEPQDKREDVNKSPQVEEIVGERIETSIIEEQTEIIISATDESEEKIQKEESGTPAIEVKVAGEKQIYDQQSFQQDTEIESSLHTNVDEAKRIQEESVQDQIETESNVPTNEDESQIVQGEEIQIETESNVPTNEDKSQIIHEEEIQIETESNVPTNEDKSRIIHEEEIQIETESNIPTNEDKSQIIHEEEIQIEIESNVPTNEDECQIIHEEEIQIEIESNVPTNEDESQIIHEEEIQIETESNVPTNEDESQIIHEEEIQIKTESNVPTNEDESQIIHEEEIQIETESNVPTNEDEAPNIQKKSVQNQIEVESLPINEDESQNIHDESVQDQIEIESFPTNEDEPRNTHYESVQGQIEIECLPTNKDEPQNIQKESVQELEIESLPKNEEESQNIQEESIKDQTAIESVPTNESEHHNTRREGESVQDQIVIQSSMPTYEDEPQNIQQNQEEPVHDQIAIESTVVAFEAEFKNEFTSAANQGEQKLQSDMEIEFFDPNASENHEIVKINLPTETTCSYPSAEPLEVDNPSHRNEETPSLADLELQTEDNIKPKVEETVDLNLLKECSNDFVVDSIDETSVNEVELQAEDHTKPEFEDTVQMETTPEDEISYDNLENEHSLTEKSIGCTTELDVPPVDELDVQKDELKSPKVEEAIESSPEETTLNFPLADKEQNQSQEARLLEENVPKEAKFSLPQNGLSTETNSEILEDKPQSGHSEENVETTCPNDAAGKIVILSNIVISPSSCDEIISPETGPPEESSEDSEKPKQKISTSDLIKRLRGKSRTKRKTASHADSSKIHRTVEMLDGSLSLNSNEVLESDNKTQSAKPESSPKIITENSDILEEKIIKEVILDLSNKQSVVEEKSELTPPIENNELSTHKGFEVGESIPNNDDKTSEERSEIDTKPEEKYPFDHIESKHDNILEQLDAQIKNMQGTRSFSNDLTNSDPAFVHEVEHMINKPVTERKRKSSSENAGPLCKKCKQTAPPVADPQSTNNFNQQPSLLSNVGCEKTTSEKLLHDIGLGCLGIFGDITMIPHDQNPPSISTDKPFVDSDTPWNSMSFNACDLTIIHEITENFDVEHPLDNVDKEPLGNASVKAATNGVSDHGYKTSDPIMSGGNEFQQDFDMIFEIGLSAAQPESYKRKESYTDWDIDPTNIIVWGVEDSPLKHISTSPHIPDGDSQIDIGNEVEVPYDNNSTCSDHIFGTLTDKLPIDAIINDETVSDPWHLQTPVEKKPKTEPSAGKSEIIAELVNFHKRKQAQNRETRAESSSSQGIPCRQNNKTSPRNFRKPTKANNGPKRQDAAAREIERDRFDAHRLLDERVSGKSNSPQRSPKDHKMYSKPSKDCPSKDNKSECRPAKDYPLKNDEWKRNSDENPRTNLYDTVKSRRRQAAAKQSIEKPRETRRSTPTSPRDRNKTSNGYARGLPDLSEACTRTPPPPRDRGKASGVFESSLDDLKMKISVTKGAAKHANNNSEFDRLRREGNKNPYFKPDNSHNTVQRNLHHESPHRNNHKSSNNTHNNRDGRRTESSNSYYWSPNEVSSRNSSHSNRKQPCEIIHDESNIPKSPIPEQSGTTTFSNNYIEKSCSESQIKVFEELHKLVQEQVKRSRKNNPHWDTYVNCDRSQYD